MVSLRFTIRKACSQVDKQAECHKVASNMGGGLAAISIVCSLIAGVPDGSEQLNFPLGQVDCDLRTDLDWDHDITWKRIGTSGRYVLCVKALNVVAEGLQEANKSNVKWFFRALKPARSIRKYIVDFRNYYQWLSYTWVRQKNSNSYGYRLQ